MPNARGARASKRRRTSASAMFFNPLLLYPTFGCPFCPPPAPQVFQNELFMATLGSAPQTQPGSDLYQKQIGVLSPPSILTLYLS